MLSVTFMKLILICHSSLKEKHERMVGQMLDPSSSFQGKWGKLRWGILSGGKSL